MIMVTRKLRRWRDRGAAAVEFALVLPLLVMILFGIMEFGYAFFIQAQVAGAARVGVRSYAINWNTVAAQNNTAAQNETAAQNTAKAIAMSEVPVPGDVSSQVITSPCVTAGSQTTLTLTYRYHSLTGLLDAVLGPNINLTGIGSMACGG
jgi:Flp pilus assembly protein TadG